MFYMLSIIYSVLCVFIPCFIYQIITVRKQKNKKRLTVHFVWVYVFLFYIYLTLSVTGSGSIWEIKQYDTLIRMEEVNLIPFQSEGFMTYVLNIIMFMPLGFLLPLIWKNFRNPKKVLLTGFALSLAIELSQLFNRRNTDVDDLLMNTLGALVGFFLWKALEKLFTNTNKKAVSISNMEPVVYLILSTSGKFLLYNWRLFIFC